MDNITIARLLDETASLLEIDAADPFRIRSYRRAAEAVEQQTTQLSTRSPNDPKALLAIPGIGKGMAANIQSRSSPPAPCPSAKSSSRNTNPPCSNSSASPAWAPRP